MPELVRLYIRHVLIGFAISALFVTGLLYLNIANLWHLVSSSDLGWVAVLMLFMFNGIVFAGVQFAMVIMRMAEDDKLGGGRKNRISVIPEMTPELAVIPVQTKD